MAAPSSTVPDDAAEVGALTYAKEIVSGAATLFQEVPVVGEVCAAFLAFEQLVKTATSNQEDLAVLVELCDVVIKGVLERCSERSPALEEALRKLEKHVKGAEVVAQLCHGKGVKRVLQQVTLSGKISRDIAAVKQNVLDISIAISLVLSHDLHVSVCFPCCLLCSRTHMTARSAREGACGRPTKIPVEI